VSDGYDQAIVVTTSSGLSTTYATACMLAGELAETDKIQLDIIDSLSIGAATGLVTLEAKSLVESGLEFGKIANRMTGAVSQTEVWFSMPTLDWLRKGGRIDEITYRLGSLLNIKPIITCNEDGKYAVRKRARGWQKVAPMQIALAEETASRFHNVRLAVSATKSKKNEAEEMIDAVKQKLKELDVVVDEILSTAFPPELLVHTGPDAMGLAVQGTTL
jgi:DegV family protein with EDD domain